MFQYEIRLKEKENARQQKIQQEVEQQKLIEEQKQKQIKLKLQEQNQLLRQIAISRLNLNLEDLDLPDMQIVNQTRLKYTELIGKEVKNIIQYGLYEEEQLIYPQLVDDTHQHTFIASNKLYDDLVNKDKQKQLALTEEGQIFKQELAVMYKTQIQQDKKKLKRQFSFLDKKQASSKDLRNDIFKIVIDDQNDIEYKDNVIQYNQLFSNQTKTQNSLIDDQQEDAKASTQYVNNMCDLNKKMGVNASKYLFEQQINQSSQILKDAQLIKQQRYMEQQSMKQHQYEQLTQNNQKQKFNLQQFQSQLQQNYDEKRDLYFQTEQQRQSKIQQGQQQIKSAKATKAIIDQFKYNQFKRNQEIIEEQQVFKQIKNIGLSQLRDRQKQENFNKITQSMQYYDNKPISQAYNSRVDRMKQRRENNSKTGDFSTVGQSQKGKSQNTSQLTQIAHIYNNNINDKLIL